MTCLSSFRVSLVSIWKSSNTYKNYQISTSLSRLGGGGNGSVSRFWIPQGARGGGRHQLERFLEDLVAAGGEAAAGGGGCHGRLDGGARGWRAGGGTGGGPDEGDARRQRRAVDAAARAAGGGAHDRAQVLLGDGGEEALGGADV